MNDMKNEEILQEAKEHEAILKKLVVVIDQSPLVTTESGQENSPNTFEGNKITCHFEDGSEQDKSAKQRLIKKMSYQASKPSPLALALKNLGVNTGEKSEDAESFVPNFKMKLKIQHSELQ